MEGENRINNEAMSILELEMRIMRDQKLLQQLRKEKDEKESDENGNNNKSPDGLIRKKTACIHDMISKNMFRLMDECDAKGFVYRIIPADGNPLSGSSENLRAWWKDKIKFNHTASTIISTLQARNDGKNEVATLDSLYGMKDTTLGSLLSKLVKHCEPPLKSFPIEGGVAPPWWPTGDEEWWSQLGFVEVLSPPPFKKPQHLKKVWKVVALVAVIKHISPNIAKIWKIIQQYSCLQDKMSTTETDILIAVLNHEEMLAKAKYLERVPSGPTEDKEVSENYNNGLNTENNKKLETVNVERNINFGKRKRLAEKQHLKNKKEIYKSERRRCEIDCVVSSEGDNEQQNDWPHREESLQLSLPAVIYLPYKDNHDATSSGMNNNPSLSGSSLGIAGDGL